MENSREIETKVFSELLRERRQKAKIKQDELAAKLRKPQSWVSRHERGELRLDFLELRDYLAHLGVSMPAFAAAFERRLTDAHDGQLD